MCVLVSMYIVGLWLFFTTRFGYTSFVYLCVPPSTKNVDHFGITFLVVQSSFRLFPYTTSVRYSCGLFRSVTCV